MLKVLKSWLPILCMGWALVFLAQTAICLTVPKDDVACCVSSGADADHTDQAASSAAHDGCCLLHFHATVVPKHFTVFPQVVAVLPVSNTTAIEGIVLEIEYPPQLS